MSATATEPTAPTRETIRQAPKVLLHDHLDGGVRAATVLGFVGLIAPAAAHHA